MIHPCVLFRHFQCAKIEGNTTMNIQETTYPARPAPILLSAFDPGKSGLYIAHAHRGIAKIEDGLAGRMGSCLPAPDLIPVGFHHHQTILFSCQR